MPGGQRKRSFLSENDSGVETDNQDGMEEEDIDVEFVFSSLSETDFHGLKTLLRQGFGPDAESLPLSSISELLISQSSIGTVVKVEDDVATDPYAVMSLIPLDSATPERVALVEYLKSKALAHSSESEAFIDLLSKKESKTGLWIHDRLLNMPPQLASPMLKMLIEELDLNPDYSVKDLILLSKVYHEVESTSDEGFSSKSNNQAIGKKKRKANDKPVFFFHPEDEIIQKYSRMSFSFPFSKQGQVSDSRRVFSDVGIEPFRTVLVIPREKVVTMIKELDEALGIQ